VVPILNARYALNAANARWGSLYDALYGTDAIPTPATPNVAGSYNPARGAKVIAFARRLLDQAAPLADGSHNHSTRYRVVDGGQLLVTLADGHVVALADPSRWWASRATRRRRRRCCCSTTAAHRHPHRPHRAIGKADPAGISDVVLEAALSTILDLEDSVAAVDAEDKILGYRNWLGILKGTLTEEVSKCGKRTFTRGLNPDRIYHAPGMGIVRLHGRSLMFLRNVGHLMTNPAILWAGGQRNPRRHHRRGGHHHHRAARPASTTASGIRTRAAAASTSSSPRCTARPRWPFAGELFGRVEQMLGLPDSTVKLGIMDEERRTSVNLKACIAAAASRVAFINTGFLDRTGDEMHTAMLAGPMRRKGDMKTSEWIQAYERSNVLVGLQCGLRGKAQIGKGMWAMPDLMAAMLEQKVGHPRPAPTPPGCPAPLRPRCTRCTTTRSTWRPCSRRTGARPTNKPSAKPCSPAC
jgi:malate synthase